MEIKNRYSTIERCELIEVINSKFIITKQEFFKAYLGNNTNIHFSKQTITKLHTLGI